MLLQSVIIGKAKEIYTQLTVGQSSSYDTVKELILKAYELVPEAYRQKCRNCTLVRKKMSRPMWNLLELKNSYLNGGALRRNLALIMKNLGSSCF